MRESIHMDLFTEQDREEDAGAVFVLESKGDITEHNTRTPLPNLHLLVFVFSGFFFH